LVVLSASIEPLVLTLDRLESDIKRLQSDLQLSRNTEQELRSQINNLSTNDRLTKSELTQLRQDNENLQSKWVHFWFNGRQSFCFTYLKMLILDGWSWERLWEYVLLCTVFWIFRLF